MLRSKFNLVLALTAVIALSGCYEIEKIFNQGTVKGVSLCMENDNSPLLSDELIKRRCIKEHQTTFSYSMTSAEGAYVDFNLEKDQADVRVVEGSSGYDNIIITEIHVSAGIRDENGKRYSKSGVIDVWLEPDEQLKGSVLIKDFGLPEGVSFDEALQTYCSFVEKKVSCRDWGISHYRGLKI